MSLRFFLLLFLLLDSSLIYGKKKISLSKAQELVLKTPNGLKSLKTRTKIIELETSGFDHVFEPKLSFNNAYGYDNSFSHKFPKLEKSSGFKSNLEVSKLFSTGTKIKGGLGVSYKDAPLAETSGDNPLVGFFSSSYDPKALESTLEIELSQSLLNGFMTRELELQKEIARDAKISPMFQQEILSQGLQYEMELLFIRYTNLVNQIKKLKKTKIVLKKMTNLRKKQEKIGQADELSIAKAEYRFLSLDIQIESLNIEKKRLEKTILLKCDLSIYGDYFIEVLDFNRKPSFSHPSKALSFALENRFDLKELHSLESPVHKEISLLKEKSKANLDLFVRYSANGVKKEFAESFKSMASQENPKIAIGLNFTVSLGSQIYDDQYKSKLLNLEVLSFKKKDLMMTLKKDLELAFFNLESIRKKKALNKKRFMSLKKQLQLEKTKFFQARGGKLALLSYDIEFNEIDLENLTLEQEEELEISHIKFITHSY